VARSASRMTGSDNLVEILYQKDATSSTLVREDRDVDPMAHARHGPAARRPTGGIAHRLSARAGESDQFAYAAADLAGGRPGGRTVRAGQPVPGWSGAAAGTRRADRRGALQGGRLAGWTIMVG